MLNNMHPSPRPMLGMCSVALRALAPADVVHVAVEAGVEVIEWGGDVHVPAGDLDRAREAARLSGESGLWCASYGSYLYAGQATSDGTAAVLDTAVALEAPNVRVWTDWVGPDPTPERRRAITDDLRRISAAAAGRDLTVSLEFHPGTLTETAASTLRLLAETDAPNLYTYWQPADGVPVENLLDGWRAVRADVSHLHVFRWHSFEERSPLAAGEDLWPSVFEELPSGGRWQHPHVALIEFVRNDDPDQLREDAHVLRHWLAKGHTQA